MSGRKVFLTGGSGFVGRTLLRELSRSPGLETVALDRSGTLSTFANDPSVTIVRGDLLDPDSYSRVLAGCDSVVHLAAATGKASTEVHTRDTAAATESLVAAARAAGVEKFLLVSSIAAAFPDKRGYPYAEAKSRAERAVATAGLRYCVLRPTMIFGEGAPVLASLAKLAMLPVVVVPGSGRVRVQPVAVEDVVRAILFILGTDRFESETFELGGPDVLRMDALLQRIRIARQGTPGRAFHVPLGMLQAPLALAERIGLRSVLPATAGQLSSFRHDGVATPNPLQREIAPELQPLDRMLGTTGATAASPDDVGRECAVFTRHLLGMSPDPTVVRNYRQALAALPALRPSSRWDRSLLSMARSSVAGARCADAVAGLFARRSALRKRLVVLLAILETRAPASERIDSALGGGAFLVITRVALRGLGSLLCVAIGALWILPVWMAHTARTEPAP